MIIQIVLPSRISVVLLIQFFMKIKRNILFMRREKVIYQCTLDYYSYNTLGTQAKCFNVNSRQCRFKNTYLRSKLPFSTKVKLKLSIDV